MILELDVGNSRIKWRILSSDERSVDSKARVLAVSAVDSAGLLFQILPNDSQLSRIRVCSVREDALLSELAGCVRARWGLELEIATVSACCGGVQNGYVEFERMGVDRWLAMIAAFNRRHTACLVVDAGTALTIDIVSGDGQHQGGYILAGLSMSVQALEDNTGIVLRNRKFDPESDPGTSTEEAVLRGTLASKVSLIQEALRTLRCRDSDAVAYLCGGDAEILSQALNSRGETGFVIERDLVLDGLAYACENR